METARVVPMKMARAKQGNDERGRSGKGRESVCMESISEFIYKTMNYSDTDFISLPRHCQPLFLAYEEAR